MDCRISTRYMHFFELVRFCYRKVSYEVVCQDLYNLIWRVCMFLRMTVVHTVCPYAYYLGGNQVNLRQNVYWNGSLEMSFAFFIRIYCLSINIVSIWEVYKCSQLNHINIKLAANVIWFCTCILCKMSVIFIQMKFQGFAEKLYKQIYLWSEQ